VTSAIADKLLTRSARGKFAAAFLRHSEDWKRCLTSRLCFLRFWRAIGNDSNQALGNAKKPVFLPAKSSTADCFDGTFAFASCRYCVTLLIPTFFCLSVRYDTVS
jgi:hypothetical protein